MGVAAVRSLKGKTIAGKYRLGDLQSDDPAGSVYRGTDLATQADVLVLALAEGVRLDGEKEARSLNHPNVLGYRFSYFPNEAQRFVVVNAPPGRSLAKIIIKRGRLHPGMSANVALQLLSALHAIHALGSFHGNLNPHNVFVNKTSRGELEVHVLYAGAAHPGPTPPNPRYLAPEQIRGEAVDRRADIWAVGAILYLCLFGRHPFDGPKPEEISGKILLKEPAFTKEAEKMPAELIDAIRSALDKEPDRRPQFANNMIGDLLATAEEFDEQMSALVATALRNSIPPVPEAKKPAVPPRTPPAKPAAPEEIPITIDVAEPEAPKPEAPKPEIVKPAAAKPAEPLKEAEERPSSMLEAARHAAAQHAAPVPSATVLGVPLPPAAILGAGAGAPRLSVAEEPLAPQEGALDIDLLEPMPPAIPPDAPHERRPLLAGRRKLALAAACLAVVAVIAVVILVVPGGEREGTATGAAAPIEPPAAAPPVEPPRAVAAEAPAPAGPPEPARAEPPEPVQAEPPEPAPRPAPATGKAVSPSASPEQGQEPSLKKNPFGPQKPSTGRKPKPSQDKGKAPPSKGAVGLASNPFGG